MNWWEKLMHTHDFKLYRIDFKGPFSRPNVTEVHISFCQSCHKARFEEYDKAGNRVYTTEV